jgi:hypothetical protein
LFRQLSNCHLDDELLSDSFGKVEIDDVVYEVDCKMITKGPISVNTGANASAEGEDDEGVDDQSYQVIDVVDSFRLEQTSFDKKSYIACIKAYMKAVKAKLEESNPGRVATFEKGAQTYVKKILEKFDDFEFYTGDSMDPEAMVIPMGYREDGITPYLIYWKDGLRAEKY